MSENLVAFLLVRIADDEHTDDLRKRRQLGPYLHTE